MMDPYKVLGVAKSASADDIKAAYRKLAKKLHPDLNPGDSDIERHFKEISQAYGIVGNSEKRKRFDRGEIDASGQETTPAGAGFYRRYAGSNEGAKYSRFEFGPESDVQDIFADFFGRHPVRPVRRGADVSYAVKVDFVEAALGAKKRIQLADGKTLDIALKPGTEDGQTLRLKGQGQAAQGKASRGGFLTAGIDLAAVESLALLRISHNAIGLGDLFETLLDVRVARVQVGMEFLGQLAVGGLDVVRAGGLRNSQNLIRVRHAGSLHQPLRPRACDARLARAVEAGVQTIRRFSTCRRADGRRSRRRFPSGRSR